MKIWLIIEDVSLYRSVLYFYRRLSQTIIMVREAYTGTKMDRPEWDKLYKKVREGDTIVFDSVSGMARTFDEGVQVYFELYEIGISLVFLKEPYINTEVYAENMKDKIEPQGTDEDKILKGICRM